MEYEIARSLSEGPDYQVDWRHRVVEQLVSRCSVLGDELAARRLLSDERDPFVRQATRLRLGVRCVNGPPLKYAYRAQATNRETGIASMIKALAVAGRRPEEIAQELHVPRANVVAYLRLFFDVERYLESTAWLRTIALPQSIMVDADPAIVRERRWLAVAFLEGWTGLKKVLFRGAPATADDVKELQLQIQAALGVRALEYVSGIHHSGVPPSREDLDRFVVVQESCARHPAEPDHSGHVHMKEWMTALHGQLEAKVTRPDDSTVSKLLTGRLDEA